MHTRLGLFLLVLISAAGLVFATGGQESDEASDGPATISAHMTYAPVAENADHDNTYYMAYVANKFNIEWDLTMVPSAAVEERMNIAFAAGDLGDVVLGGASGPIYQDAIRSGQATELTEMIENGSGWINHPRWDEIRPVITHTDGNIYTLPSGVYNMLATNSAGRYYLNQAWLEAAGRGIPETLDELTAGLRAMQEEMSDKIIISGRWENKRITDYFMLAHGMKVGGNASGLAGLGPAALGNMINIVDGEVVFSPVHSNFESYLRYVNGLWEEGLIDEEYFTQQDGQLRAKGTRDGFGLAADDAYPLIFGDSDAIYDYTFAPPLLSEYNDELWWPSQTVLSIPNALIPVTSGQADKVWEILDWMGTPEHVFVYDGYIAEEHFNPELIPEGLERDNVLHQPADGGDYYVRGNAVEGMAPWQYMNTFLTNRTANLPMVLDRGADWWTEVHGFQPITPQPRNLYLGYTVQEIAEPHYVHKVNDRDLKFTIEEQRTLDNYLPDLQAYIDENHAKFIIGTRPISEYDDFVEELDRYRLDEITAVYQAAYDRYAGN